jgi:hypothetical protein
MPSQTARRRAGKRTARHNAAAVRREQLTQITDLLDQADSQFAAVHDPEGVWGLSEHGFALISQARTLTIQVLGDAPDELTRERLEAVSVRLGEFEREYAAWGFAPTVVCDLLDDARDVARRVCGGRGSAEL